MTGFDKGVVFALVAVTACDQSEPAKPSSWLISMPDLEREQAARPVYLKTSENWDSRLVPAAEIADPGMTTSTPLMAKLISCGPKSVTMISGSAAADVVDMPVRYSVVEQGRSDAVEDCLRSVLPSGFEMKQLN